LPTESTDPRWNDNSSPSENKNLDPSVQQSASELVKTQRENQQIKHGQFAQSKSRKEHPERKMTSEGALFNHSDNLVSVNRELRNASPIQLNDETAISNNCQDQLHSDQVKEDAIVSSSFQKTTGKNNNPVKKTNWQFQLNASAGMSDLGEQLLETAAASGLYFDPLQSSVGGVVSHTASEVKSGPSFSIGASANKSIGKKWAVGVGISYQYFSNNIKVGEKVDSVVVINQNSFAMDRVSQYYKSNGSTPYTNQYHFISLPLSFQWQFAKKFSWQSGLVASKMINTNALHYDGVSGKYYEDENLFNEFQVSATTAVLFGFKKNKIQVGPQLQYAFTNLLKPGTGNARHLRSVAVMANVELWKK